MSRLYDQIIEHGLHEAPEDLLSLIRRPDTVNVDVNNVAQYIAATHHKDNREKSWTPSEFPSIAPPWKLAFFEWKPEFKDIAARGMERCGMLMVGVEYTEDVAPVVFEELLPELNTEPHWLVSCSVIVQMRGMVPHFMGTFVTMVDVLGRICVYKDSVQGDAPIFTVPTEQIKAEAEMREVETGLEQMVAPALLGISFLHCKNVSSTLNEPPEKIQRRRVRKGKKPLKAYYTLEIEPMAQTLNREGSAKETGIKQALHICRGHFATYSPDKPLFGKYSGTFWKPQHVKGSKQHGEVVKDYAVKSPGGVS